MGAAVGRDSDGPCDSGLMRKGCDMARFVKRWWKVAGLCAYSIAITIYCCNLHCRNRSIYNWNIQDSVERYRWDFSMTGQCVKYLRESESSNPMCKRYIEVLSIVCWEGVLRAYSKGCLDAMIADAEKSLPSLEKGYPEIFRDAHDYLLRLKSIRDYIVGCALNGNHDNSCKCGIENMEISPPEDWNPEQLISSWPVLIIKIS